MVSFKNSIANHFWEKMDFFYFWNCVTCLCFDFDFEFKKWNMEKSNIFSQIIVIPPFFPPHPSHFFLFIFSFIL